MPVARAVLANEVLAGGDSRGRPRSDEADDALDEALNGVSRGTWRSATQVGAAGSRRRSGDGMRRCRCAEESHELLVDRCVDRVS
jgi:hypothetical protein